MAKTLKTSPTRRFAAAGMVAMFLFFLIAMPASASVNALRNAFNPRGFFVTLKSGDQPEWLRSSFETGFYRAGEGGQGGGGGGTGANKDKDDLGHSGIQHIDGETGLDYVEASEVDTIYSTYDHNPTPGKDFMIGYSKDEQAKPLEAIPDFTRYIGNPGRGSDTVSDPSGGQWWNVPVKLTLGKEHDDGTRDAMMPGTLYEFAYLRGNQANNGTTCVLMPGDTDGTYKGYLYNPDSFTEEEKAVYEAHKYDEYEFITAILPEGTSSNTNVDHAIESVPMRYHIQTYADLTTWTDSAERKEAETFLASVQESDYSSGKYVKENVAALQTELQDLDREADEEVRYQLQKDAEYTILQMIEDLKAAMDTAKLPREVVDFGNYNTALSNAERVYAEVKDNAGTNIDQYRPEAVEALRQAIDHAKSTVGSDSKQSEVDAETSALVTATSNALDALIRPAEEVTFTDSVTGITVTALSTSLTPNTRLVVREVVNTTSEFNAYVTRVSPVPDVAAVYRILFYDGIDVVNPTAPVTVQIPLQDTLAQTAPSVYYLDETGSLGQNVNASTPEGYRVFTTSQLGTFVVGGKKQTTPEEPTSQKREEPTSQKQEEPTSQKQEEPSSQNDQTPTQPPTYSTTRNSRTTTRATATRTTRIIRTTRNANEQNKQNEMTTTSVLQTQAVRPTTMTTTAPPPTSAQDTSDLEQEPNQHTLLYIALAVATVGIGAAAYEFYKDKKNGGLGTDNDEL